MSSKLKQKSLRYTGALYRATNFRSDVKYKDYNLQKGQYMFLTRICENPGINFMDLSAMLKVDKTTTTKAVQKLIEIGYVEKVQDELDKRGYKLTPTTKALEIYNLIIKEENRQLDICFKNFSEEEKTMAEKLLKRMSENIEEYWNELKVNKTGGR